MELANAIFSGLEKLCHFVKSRKVFFFFFREIMKFDCAPHELAEFVLFYEQLTTYRFQILSLF